MIVIELKEREEFLENVKRNRVYVHFHLFYKQRIEKISKAKTYENYAIA